MEKVLKALASALKMDVSEFLETLKDENGEFLAEADLAAKVQESVSARVIETQKAQHGKGLSDYEKKIARIAREKGFDNPDGLKGEELMSAMLDWQAEQAATNGSGEPSADAAKLQAERDKLAKQVEKLQAANETLKGEYEGYKKTATRETIRAAALAEIARVADEKRFVLGDATERAKRLNSLAKLADLDSFGKNAAGKLVKLNEDGTIYTDEFGKEVPFETHLEEVNPFGVHNQDPNRGGANPNSREGQGGNNGNGSIRFETEADYTKAMAGADAATRLKYSEAWQLKLEAEEKAK
jgi:hypothetical protein